MQAVAAGMESDFSDSDCDMVFNIGNDSKESKMPAPERKAVSNGGVSNSMRQPKYQERNNSRPTSRFRPQHKNQNQQGRRQCLDIKSSQFLDDLRYAIMQGNLENTKNILAKGIWVDTILKAGWTGLMYACSSGHPEIVSYLLEMKADPNYHRDMFTPLMAVCASNKNESDLFKCCSLLLQYGAKVDAHERHYTTPLMFAAREGYCSITKELLDHGADPNLQDNRGKTALAWAASKGYGQVIRLLIEKGADKNIFNNMGQSPMDIAYEHGHNEIVSLLQSELLQNSSGDCTDIVKASDVKEISKPSKPADTKSYVKVGELELFLSGVGLPDLIPTFNEHQLNFNDLLIMDETELEKVGIHQVGARKKLLEACKAVHKKEWEQSSLPNLKQKQYITCPDAVAMMANIAKHLKYISSSVIYIRQQIQSQPRILELSQDSANVHDLLDEMEDSLKNVRFLNDEMRFLKLHLERVQDQVQFIPADLIVETIPSNQNQKRILFTAISIATLSALITGLMWKHPTLLSHIPTSIRIRVPFLT